MTVLSFEITTGDVTHGAWCALCQLPAAVQFTVYEMSAEWVGTLGHVTYCPDCDDWETTEETT